MSFVLWVASTLALAAVHLQAYAWEVLAFMIAVMIAAATKGVGRG